MAKKKTYATPDQRVKRALKYLDNILSVENNDEYDGDDVVVATKLWDILTGLRGPDQAGGVMVKSSTTGVIRQHALPKTFTRDSFISNNRAVAGNDCGTYAERRRLGKTESAGLHFVRHAERAFMGLGLNWVTNND